MAMTRAKDLELSFYTNPESRVMPESRFLRMIPQALVENDAEAGRKMIRLP